MRNNQPQIPPPPSPLSQPLNDIIPAPQVNAILSNSVPTVLMPDERDLNFSSAYDGIYAPSLRYPQFSLDALLQERGYQFVEDMMNMAACRAPFDLKRYAVLQDSWDIVPCQAEPKHPDHEKAKMLADDLRYALNNIRDYVTDFPQDFTAILFEAMYGAWTGNKVLEIDWQYQKHGALKGKLGFKGIYAKTNRQMAFDVDPNTLALKNFTSYTPGQGYDFHIPVEKCLYYVHNQTNNLPAGNGDWRASYKHWFRLDGNLKFWAMALERWGSPVFIAQYPGGDSAALAAARKAMDSIRQGSAPLIPDNIKYELVTAPQQVFIGFEAACRFDTEQLAINIVGNSLTTGAGDNSLALGQVHQMSGATYDDALAERVCRTFEQQLFHRFVRYNYGPELCHLTPKLTLKKKREDDMLKIAQSLQILIESGNMPSQSAVIRDQMNLPAISPEEQELLDAEKAAIAEAQAQIAAGRNENKVMKLSSFDVEKTISYMAQVLYYTQFAKFDRDRIAKHKAELEALEQRMLAA